MTFWFTVLYRSIGRKKEKQLPVLNFDLLPASESISSLLSQSNNININSPSDMLR